MDRPTKARRRPRGTAAALLAAWLGGSGTISRRGADGDVASASAPMARMLATATITRR